MPLRSARKLRIEPPKPVARAAGKTKPKKGKRIAPSGAQVAAQGVIDIPHVYQEQTNWCWAACSQMVGAWAGVLTVPSQAAIVTSLKGSPQNVTASGPEIVRLYSQVGLGGQTIPCKWITSHLGQVHLDAELTRSVPVEIGLRWNGGGGHVVLVVGSEPDEQLGTLYTVHDPFHGVGRFTYQGLMAAYGQGRWVESYGLHQRRESSQVGNQYHLEPDIKSALAMELGQHPTSAGSAKHEPQRIEVVRVGRSTNYRLQTPVLGRFVAGTDGSPGRFEVKGFEDIAIGRGTSAELALKDWENRLHVKFQELYHLQNADELEPPANALWVTLSHLIDVEAYRKSASIVGREIGKVVKTAVSGKLIQWQSGTEERVRYDRAPGALVNVADGEWLQAMVTRHPDTYTIRRILWLKPYTPWSGNLDDVHKAKIEQIPTISSLPKTTWD